MTNIFNSPRYIAVVVVVALASSMGIFATRRRVRLVFAAALVGLLFVFPALGGLRNSRQIGSITSELSRTFASGDYDSFAQVANSMTFVSEAGHTLGRQLLGAIFVWVPRSAWPDKPISTSSMVASFMGYDFTNLSSPTWAEFYVDFGVVGVTLGFLVLGCVFALLDARILLELAHGRPLPVSAAIVPFYCLILLRGSLLSTVPVLLVVLASSALLFRRRSDHGGSR